MHAKVLLNTFWILDVYAIARPGVALELRLPARLQQILRAGNESQVTPSKGDLHKRTHSGIGHGPWQHSPCSMWQVGDISSAYATC
jgi:hypothetical protein